MIDALLQLGCHEEARSLFWWFMQATALTEPKLHVLYRLDGGIGTAERTLPLAGYRGSRPGADRQRRGGADAARHLRRTCSKPRGCTAKGDHALDRDTGACSARIADHVCDIWRQPDSGIWEVRNGPFHFTHSKVMCWVALDRAVRLAERGELPAPTCRALAARSGGDPRRSSRRECWSERLRSYTRTAGSERRRRQPADAAARRLSAIRGGRAHQRHHRRGHPRCCATATSSIAITPRMACRAGKAAS